MTFGFAAPTATTPVTLGVNAAQHGFFKLGIVWLRQLARHYKIDISAKASLCDVLTAAIKKFLPQISDEDLLAILAKRVNLTGGAADEDVSWADEAIHEVCEAGDEEVLAKHNAAEQNETKDTASLKKEVLALKTKVFSKRRANPKKKAKKGKAEPRLPAPPLVGTELLNKDRCCLNPRVV